MNTPTGSGHPDRSRGGRITRRTLIAGTGSLASAAPLSAHVASDDADLEPRDKRDVVLRDSDHIRTYYKLARS